jgi:hypothetical protein
MKKILITGFILIAFTACKKEAKSMSKVDAFELELLFEKDGCKVYRFYDGNYIYWANCAGTISYEYSTQVGKSRTTHQVQEFTTK